MGRSAISVLAYITWHRPRADVDTAVYEDALERFHRSLARVPPSGFDGSSAFCIGELPWQAEPTPHEPAAYEDWYLVESWSALGVLEEAAVARGHVSRHDAVASLAAKTVGGVYRLSEGHARPERARVGVWVAPPFGHAAPTAADLLGDGMDRDCAALWRRCLGLGPAPEYCLLAPEVPAGVAPARLPAGWTVRSAELRTVWRSPARSG
jgi:hypothetical protein